MKILSIITPIYNPVPEHLRAAYESLRNQTVPDGWEWEWIVQEDGRNGAAREILPTDERVKHGAGRHGGVAITRNLGLASAAGSLIKNLDQDDLLTPGVIARDIAILSSHPDICWSTSRVLDLLPDGSTVGFDDPLSGRIEPGFVLDHWRSHNYRLPVHPTTVCIRRKLLTALGGWMAVPGSDDTGMFIAASVLAAGYFHNEVGLLYRKWSGQVTASAEHTEPVEWNSRMSLIRERAAALASGAIGARTDVPPPTARVDATLAELRATYEHLAVLVQSATEQEAVNMAGECAETLRKMLDNINKIRNQFAADL
jgi:glycosyltransferase involved in cell wall biosynthesis